MQRFLFHIPLQATRPSWHLDFTLRSVGAKRRGLSLTGSMLFGGRKDVGWANMNYPGFQYARCWRI